MFIHDEKAILKALSRLLQKIGFSVQTADNSKEAINIFKQNPKLFDLIILDYRMPVMNGFEVYKQLKK